MFIWSPNEDENDGHGYVCAFDDDCLFDQNPWWGRMSKGPGLWEAVSNKGGPQPFVWGSDPKDEWN